MFPFSAFSTETNHLTPDEIADPIMMVMPMFNVEPITLFLSLWEWLLVHMNVTTEALYDDDFEDEFPSLPPQNVGDADFAFPYAMYSIQTGEWIMREDGMTVLVVAPLTQG
ncbi:hypothetical protein L1987_50011 [Smallanthus sonchifolius]|uniref:Uncharacterized protein n=1 Tax=Smallanthus sonchifolius TaxID=185202 RepID=A0ACB9FX59_9ASTR|nr:hypothetical protein L1987_50011 [Smallanthus sonchifolius]